VEVLRILHSQRIDDLVAVTSGAPVAWWIRRIWEFRLV